MEVLANLEPKNVMHWFEFVCSYPHGSLKEEKLAAAIMEFARSRGLECKEDAWHNVLVRKPASPGYENQPPVLLQAHIDTLGAMVCSINVIYIFFAIYYLFIHHFYQFICLL